MPISHPTSIVALLVLSLLACSDPKCPEPFIQRGMICRRCPEGSEPRDNQCVAIDGGQVVDAEAESNTNDEDGGPPAELDSDAQVAEEMDGSSAAPDASVPPSDARASGDADAGPIPTCSMENGDCAQICNTSNGACSCNAGYALESNGKSCRLRKWGTAVPLESLADGVVATDLAAGANGHAAVAFELQGAAATNIWLTNYVPSTGWTDPVQVSAAVRPVEAHAPRVAVLSDGGALILWSQGGEIWTRRRTAGGTLNPAERLATDSVEDFTANEQGDVLVTTYSYFNENTGTGNIKRHQWGLYRFTQQRGWAAQSSPLPNAGITPSMRMALDADGLGYAVWQECSNPTAAIPTYSLWARKTKNDGTWEPAALLSGTEQITIQRVVASAGGVATLWRDAQNAVVASQLLPAQSWTIASKKVVASWADVLVVPAGEATLIWSNLEPIYVASYGRSAGWSAGVRVSTDISGMTGAALFSEDDFVPRAVATIDGVLVTAWPERPDPANYNGRFDIWSSVMVPGQSWQPRELIEHEDGSSAREVRLAASSSGAVFGLFKLYDGSSIWTNRYE